MFARMYFCRRWRWSLALATSTEHTGEQRPAHYARPRGKDWCEHVRSVCRYGEALSIRLVACRGGMQWDGVVANHVCNANARRWQSRGDTMHIGGGGFDNRFAHINFIQ